MKQILGLLICAFILNSCDDGDIAFKKFNFDPTAAVNKCTTNNGLYFKIKNSEALILKIPATSFLNEETATGSPRKLTINSTNQVLYRLFNDVVSNTYFCSDIPPATPIVFDEWNATEGVQDISGTIEIATTKILNTTTQAITGYNHLITFRNITFKKTSNALVYEEYVFGNYVTTP